jgi:hypothetical protein
MLGCRSRLSRRTAAGCVALLVAAGAGAEIGTAADTAPPMITKLKASPAKFCARKSRKCAHPGTTVSFTLSTAATVRSNMWQRDRNVGGYAEFSGKFKAGANSARINDSRLTPGRWTIKLWGVNSVAAGNTAIIDVHVVK